MTIFEKEEATKSDLRGLRRSHRQSSLLLRSRLDGTGQWPAIALIDSDSDHRDRLLSQLVLGDPRRARTRGLARLGGHWQLGRSFFDDVYRRGARDSRSLAVVRQRGRERDRAEGDDARLAAAVHYVGNRHRGLRHADCLPARYRRDHRADRSLLGAGHGRH